MINTPRRNPVNFVDYIPVPHETATKYNGRSVAPIVDWAVYKGKYISQFDYIVYFEHRGRKIGMTVAAEEIVYDMDDDVQVREYWAIQYKPGFAQDISGFTYYGRVRPLTNELRLAHLFDSKRDAAAVCPPYGEVVAFVVTVVKQK